MINEDLFWAKVEKSDGCWNWTAAKTKKGYGVFGLEKPRLAHRISYILLVGEIPEGICVCHKCDNPSCCNPDHFFLGTNTDNVADRHSKGRSRGGILPGSLAPPSKLIESQVLEIKRLHKEGVTQRRLGKDFSVHFATINDIVRGKTWRHVA